MSSIKEYAFEVEQERCLAWIKRQYGVEVDPDEDPETWEVLSAEYSAMLDAEMEEAEYRWLERHSHNEFFNDFSRELATASDLLELGQDDQRSQTVYKLVYAHAVTLLEALISSVVRTLVVNYESVMMNVATGYEELSKKKFTLKEVAMQPKGVESIVLKALTELSFHNPSTIKTVLDAMFGKHMLGLKLDEISPICIKRHDIVHRNGRTVDDEPIHFDCAEVLQAIMTIREFAADLKRRIYNAVQQLEQEASPF